MNGYGSNFLNNHYPPSRSLSELLDAAIRSHIAAEIPRLISEVREAMLEAAGVKPLAAFLEGQPYMESDTVKGADDATYVGTDGRSAAERK